MRGIFNLNMCTLAEGIAEENVFLVVHTSVCLHIFQCTEWYVVAVVLVVKGVVVITQVVVDIIVIFSLFSAIFPPSSPGPRMGCLVVALGAA